MQKITIFGPITDELATALRTQLDTLNRAEPLLVEINSDGGSVQAGVSIYSALVGWPAGVITEVSGWALSVASVILMAGSTRRCHPTSLVMVHAPWTGVKGNAQELRRNADLLDVVSKTLTAAYLRTGQPERVIQGWLSGIDHWFTADEAQQLGLVTEIVNAAEPAVFANAMACSFSPPPQLVSRINAMTTTAPVHQKAAIEAAAIQAEAQRRRDIRASGQVFMNHAGMPAFIAALEDDPSVSAAEAGLRILARLGQGATPVAGGYSFRDVGDDRLSDFRNAAEDALLIRGGLKVAQPHPGVRDMQRMGIVAMAESMLSMTGREPRDRSAAGIIQAAMATDDFSRLLSNTASKSLALGYETAPTGHTLFTGEREVANFHPQTLVNLSEAPELEEVREGAEYKNGSMADSATTFQLVTNGKVLELTRQALINDDLGALTSIPMSMGIAARRLEADKVFGALTGNPVMRDGQPLFHAAHGNLGVGSALSLASLGLARAAMRKQRGIAGLGFLDPQPKFLIVPVGLETVAEQLISSLQDPSKNNETPNLQFVRGLTLVADPRLDAHSETAWYLAASPTQIDGILRVYLAGQERLYVEENNEFKRDVTGFKVRLDFGVGVIDHRALYKNPGV